MYERRRVYVCEQEKVRARTRERERVCLCKREREIVSVSMYVRWGEYLSDIGRSERGMCVSM